MQDNSARSHEELISLSDFWQLKDYDKGQLIRGAGCFLLSRVALLGICCAVPVAFGYIIGWICS